MGLAERGDGIIMVEQLLSNSQILVIGIISAVMIVVMILVLKFFKKDKGFKPFIPVLFEETIHNDLRKKINLHGKKLKNGRIVMGFDVLAHIDKYYQTKGDMPLAIYDEAAKDFKFLTDEKGNQEKIQYDFTIFRLKNKLFLYRWLGIKKMYLIMRNTDDEKNVLVRFDDKTNRVFFPKAVEFDSYGNIWHESQVAKEYMNNISFLEMLQQMQTHLQNIPNRTVHLEVEQAKKERLYNTIAEIEKGKYDRMKTGEETVIS